MFGASRLPWKHARKLNDKTDEEIGEEHMKYSAQRRDQNASSNCAGGDRVERGIESGFAVSSGLILARAMFEGQDKQRRQTNLDSPLHRISEKAIECGASRRRGPHTDEQLCYENKARE